MSFNDTLMQYFEWELPDDGKHWQRLKEDAPHLAEKGISFVWMPPAFKATGTNDVGYGVYDLFDLGEFDQKGSVRTKYGTKEEYLEAIQALQDNGVRPIADVVLNHKAAGDEKEQFHVLKMNPTNRQEPMSAPFEIEGYTYFKFPGRQGKYNDFEWHWYHFSGLDYDARRDETGVYMILGDDKGWADNESVDNEMGNYDYLMFTDIDYSHPEVRKNLMDWAKWFIEETGVSGFRLDAIKHIDSQVVADFIKIISDTLGRDNFYVFGEYWNADFTTNVDYLESIDYEFDLVDVKLHMNFHEAGERGSDYNLTQIFDSTLMQNQPWNAVTFVENHDTQPGQSLESPVAEWFKSLAYGMILLLESGLPTIFYGDYYGTYDKKLNSISDVLDKLLYLRKYYAYGKEVRHFDHANCIGWVRLGTDDFPNGLAVVISNADEGWKEMSLGEIHAGEVWVDYLGHYQGEVVLDGSGTGQFPVSGGSISAWVNRDTL